MTKKIFFGLLSLMITSILFAQEELQFKTYWKNGFKVESTDNRFKLAFGGRINYDYAFFFQESAVEEAVGKIKNGTEFRRARLYHAGTIYDFVNYRFEVDFASGRVSFKNVYISFSKVPVIGNVRAGIFKEPLRLETLTSDPYSTFMERSFPQDFAPEYNNGIMIFNDHLKSRLGWQAGIFRNADISGNDVQADERFNVDGRITGVPWQNEDKSHLLYLGLAYSFRKFGNTDYRIASRPETHLGPVYTVARVNDSNHVNLLGEEVALVLGSFSIQAEAMQSLVNDSLDNNYTFMSYYGQASYFITGEHRNYKDSYSGFDRVNPKKNLGKEGCGAWEVALRYSATDLNSESVNGGQMQDVTLGVNWYMNPVTRIMFNYIFSHLQDVGNTSIVQTRLQIDF